MIRHASCGFCCVGTCRAGEAFQAALTFLCSHGLGGQAPVFGSNSVGFLARLAPKSKMDLAFVSLPQAKQAGILPHQRWFEKDIQKIGCCIADWIQCTVCMTWQFPIHLTFEVHTYFILFHKKRKQHWDTRKSIEMWWYDPHMILRYWGILLTIHTLEAPRLESTAINGQLGATPMAGLFGCCLFMDLHVIFCSQDNNVNT